MMTRPLAIAALALAACAPSLTFNQTFLVPEDLKVAPNGYASLKSTGESFDLTPIKAQERTGEHVSILKVDGCEAAYLKYKEAGEKIGPKAVGRSAQLQGVVANKLDKLETCYRSCQPNEKQRELFNTAKESAESEPHRSARILRQLLVGR